MSVIMVFVAAIFCSLQLAWQVEGNYVPDIPASCLNSTYCEDIPNYPLVELNQLIAKMGESWQSQVDQLVYSRSNIKNDPDDIPLCEAQEKTIYPRAAISDDGKWYNLVNTEQGVQGFQVEICNNPGSTCNAVVMPHRGYEGICKQAYIKRVATAFEKKDNGETRLFKKSVPIPSTCTCIARPVYP